MLHVPNFISWGSRSHHLVIRISESLEVRMLKVDRNTILDTNFCLVIIASCIIGVSQIVLSCISSIVCSSNVRIDKAFVQLLRAIAVLRSCSAGLLARSHGKIDRFLENQMAHHQGFVFQIRADRGAMIQVVRCLRMSVHEDDYSVALTTMACICICSLECKHFKCIEYSLCLGKQCRKLAFVCWTYLFA